MNKNRLLKKGIVFGIMLLFIGTSIVSSILEKKSKEDILTNQNGLQPWWDYNWNYRRNITINHNYIDSSLSNFPVLVVINSTIGAKCDDGNSIRFLSIDNTIEYNYEIELWDTSGNSYVWVNITNVPSSTDTVFFMYYNNSGASDNQNSTGVWDSGFIGVWHMNDSTTSTVLDSTSNDHDGTKTVADDPQEVTGKIGKGQFFDSASDRISLGDHADYALGDDFTITLWQKNTDAGDVYTYFLGQLDGAPYWIAQIYASRLGWGSNESGNYDCGIWVPTQGLWNYVVWSVNSNTLSGYANGFLIGAVVIPSVGDSAGDLNLGQAKSDSSSHYVKGTLDEIRFSNVARNWSWVNATYHVTNQTTGFITFGNEELIKYPPIANFTYTPTNPTKNETIYFTDASTDLDGIIVSWFWDFDDGHSSSLRNPMHQYSDDGTYNVTLTVTDDDGATGSISKNITAIDGYPPQIIDNTPNAGYTGDPFTFNATVSDNVQVSTVWVEYWYGIGTHTNVSMNNVASDYWEYTIIANDTLDILHYIISSNDSSNNWNNTGVKNVTIYDIDDPEITDITFTPSDPIDTDVTYGWENVTCNVTDNIAVATVKLVVTNDTATVEYTMINIPGTYTYYYNTTFTQPGNYTYHIWTDDFSGNNATSTPKQFGLPTNWDVDMDGRTYSNDLMRVIWTYGDTGHEGWIREDIDNDGHVYSNDLMNVIWHYGEYWWT